MQGICARYLGCGALLLSKRDNQAHGHMARVLTAALLCACSHEARASFSDISHANVGGGREETGMSALLHAICSGYTGPARVHPSATTQSLGRQPSACGAARAAMPHRGRARGQTARQSRTLVHVLGAHLIAPEYIAQRTQRPLRHTPPRSLVTGSPMTYPMGF